jgi:hypothetical protein
VDNPFEYPFDVAEAVNKAAGGVCVTLSPPFRAESAEALRQFTADFDAYCEAAWVLGCLVPTEISLPAEAKAWPRGQVHGPHTWR